MLVNLNCPNCGAGLPPSFNISGMVKCSYCGTTFHIPDTLTPEPDMGDLLLGADFHQMPIAGWQVQDEEKTSLLPGPPPELCARFQKSNLVHYVLYTSGILDNLDASVTLRFVAGDVKWIRAGLFLRYNTALGGYGIFVSAQGTYMFGYYERSADGNLAWHTLIDWTTHTSLRTGLDQANRLRLLARNQRIQIYLNGVLAASFSDSRFEVGQVRLAVEPSGNSDIEAAFSDLQIRQVRV